VDIKHHLCNAFLSFFTLDFRIIIQAYNKNAQKPLNTNHGGNQMSIVKNVGDILFFLLLTSDTLLYQLWCKKQYLSIMY